MVLPNWSSSRAAAFIHLLINIIFVSGPVLGLEDRGREKKILVVETSNK